MQKPRLTLQTRRNIITIFININNLAILAIRKQILVLCSFTCQRKNNLIFINESGYICIIVSTLQIVYSNLDWTSLCTRRGCPPSRTLFFGVYLPEKRIVLLCTSKTGSLTLSNCAIY